MAIEIRLESSWDTDDGEGRTVEVSVTARRHPSEDPAEDSRYFASGDVEAIKRHLCELVDRRHGDFAGERQRECARCGRVSPTEARGPEFVCPSCE
ncbi:MAG TPA: hypothetical protein VLK65_25385 [Vicinamibacteria bacterium]|nr:hypothetical protein [Vicinamibacteria bacterium]